MLWVLLLSVVMALRNDPCGGEEIHSKFVKLSRSKFDRNNYNQHDDARAYEHVKQTLPNLLSSRSTTRKTRTRTLKMSKSESMKMSRSASSKSKSHSSKGAPTSKSKSSNESDKDIFIGKSSKKSTAMKWTARSKGETRSDTRESKKMRGKAEKKSRPKTTPGKGKSSHRGSMGMKMDSQFEK